MLNKKKGYISIIVPIYNAENFLKDCLNSILDQTYKNFELILVDDGSTDSSKIIIDDYANRDNKIRAIHKKNNGISEARYTGLKESIGEFICFVDSDDLLHKQSLELMIEAIYKEKADLVFCDYLEFVAYENLKKIFEKRNEYKSHVYQNYRQVIKSMPIMPWGKLYRKELFEKLDFFQYRKELPSLFLEDIFFVPQIANESNKIVGINKQLYYYRINPNSITRSDELKPYHLELYKVKKIMLNFWQKNYYEEEYRLALREYGNILIKTYMALEYKNSVGKYKKELLQKEIEKQFKEIYSTIYKNAIVNTNMRISFKVFHLSPNLWRIILGWYYKKNYINIKRIK